MKKKLSLLSTLLCLSFVFNANVLATSNESAALELKAKLSKFEAIKSDFTQKIISPDGTLLNEGKGTLTISRPGKVLWEITAPEKEEIISNGKVVWFYTPFIEQVTILDYDSAIAGSAFILLAGASDETWTQYTVSKESTVSNKKTKFTIKKKSKRVSKNAYIIEFDKEDHISGFSRIESSGQKSSYVFDVKRSYKKPSDSLFEFKIPKGIEVDDQR